MSFYGNVTYYLSNAFNKIIYRNTNSKNSKTGSTESKTGPGTPSYEYALSPRSRNDETILETGNKWIVFGDPKKTVGNNQIQIFHQIVQDNEADVNPAPFTRKITTTPNPQEGQPPIPEKTTPIEWGYVIGIPSITYDNAGHIVKSDVTKFQMPTPQSEEDLNDIKKRLAQLEEYTMGKHDPDTGGGSVDELEPGLSHDEMLNALNVKVNNWDVGTGSKILEPYGIGTTFHEFLADFGLRKRVTSAGKTQYEQLQQNAYGEYDWGEGTYMRTIQTAQQQANQSREYASRNRNAINDIIDGLLAAGINIGISRLPVDYN